MTRAFAATIAAFALAAAVVRAAENRGALPQLGTALSDFPEAPGASVARAACLQCHSADMARQQRLTEKQWNAEIDKMVKWGSVLKDADRLALVSYLSGNFGPANASFQPSEAAPASVPAH